MSARAQRYAQRSRLQGPSPEPAPQQKPSRADFRSRLRSVGATDEPRTTPIKQPGKDDVAPRQVMEQFETAFALPSSACITATRCAVPDKKDAGHKTDALFAQLSDVFTQAGCTTYSTAVEQLSDARSCIEKRISEYRDSSSAVLKAHEELYSNVEWPLSRTQCSSKAHPKATVGIHLEKLATQLKLAEDRLGALAQDWKACVEVESKMWRELGDTGKQNHAIGLRDSFGSERNITLCEKAKSIAKAKCELIDEIEDKFKERLRAEGQKMMKSMMTMD